jgi:hypothetical protein
VCVDEIEKGRGGMSYRGRDIMRCGTVERGNKREREIYRVVE